MPRLNDLVISLADYSIKVNCRATGGNAVAVKTNRNTNKGKGNWGNQNGAPREKCFHCGRGTHSPDDCWRLCPEKAPDWFKNKQTKQSNKGAQKEQLGTQRFGLTLARDPPGAEQSGIYTGA